MYRDGDQVHYWRFYDVLQFASPSEVMDLARGYVNSGEPVSAYILFAGAKLGIYKSTYISIINVIFLWSIYLLLKRFRQPWYIYMLLYSKETLENPATLRENGRVIAGVDRLHGRQAVWFW